jgi:hypothetical protein
MNFTHSLKAPPAWFQPFNLVVSRSKQVKATGSKPLLSNGSACARYAPEWRNWGTQVESSRIVAFEAVGLYKLNPVDP